MFYKHNYIMYIHATKINLAKCTLMHGSLSLLLDFLLKILSMNNTILIQELTMTNSHLHQTCILIFFLERCGLESVHKFGMQLTANDTTLIELKILLAICCTSFASLVQLQRANHQENTNKSRDMHEETTNIKKLPPHFTYALPSSYFTNYIKNLIRWSSQTLIT